MECELIKAALEVADSLWKLAKPRTKRIFGRRHDAKDSELPARARIFSHTAHGTIVLLRIAYRPALALLGLIAAWS